MINLSLEKKNIEKTLMTLGRMAQSSMTLSTEEKEATLIAILFILEHQGENQ